MESLRAEFGVLTGNKTIFLRIAVIEGILVFALFVFTGLRLQRLPPSLRSGDKSGVEEGAVELGSRDRE